MFWINKQLRNLVIYHTMRTGQIRTRQIQKLAELRTQRIVNSSNYELAEL